MNIEALQKTRDSVANEENQLDMSSWENCVAAHAARVAGIGRLYDEHSMNFRNLACVREFLDIDIGMASLLFAAPRSRVEAVAALDRLIERAARNTATTMSVVRDTQPEPELVEA